MQSYTLNAVVGTLPNGDLKYQEFTVQASNWGEARAMLDTLVRDAKANQ